VLEILATKNKRFIALKPKENFIKLYYFVSDIPDKKARLFTISKLVEKAMGKHSSLFRQRVSDNHYKFHNIGT
jgi:hypothetical protein